MSKYKHQQAIDEFRSKLNEVISDAFFNGINEGGIDYAGDAFSPDDYGEELEQLLDEQLSKKENECKGQHNFQYSHKEYYSDLEYGGTALREVTYVVCTKCGLIKRN